MFHEFFFFFYNITSYHVNCIDNVLLVTVTLPTLCIDDQVSVLPSIDVTELE
jgi:hypothetical protein